MINVIGELMKAILMLYRVGERSCLIGSLSQAAGSLYRLHNDEVRGNADHFSQLLFGPFMILHRVMDMSGGVVRKPKRYWTRLARPKKICVECELLTFPSPDRYTRIIVRCHVRSVACISSNRIADG